MLPKPVRRSYCTKLKSRSLQVRNRQRSRLSSSSVL